MKLTNKIIAITSSSSGIGEQMAYAFSREKAKVVITYHSDKSEADHVAQECLKNGANEVLKLQLEIKDTESITHYVDHILEKFGVRGFVQSLAKEHPELQIFAICPGLTATEMTGYKGVKPAFVANLVVKAVKDDIHIPQGGDLDTWEIAEKQSVNKHTHLS